LGLAIFGLSGWIIIARQDELQLAPAYAANTVCSSAHSEAIRKEGSVNRHESGLTVARM